ncbi:hypothetical protein [Streptomyces sp. NPDC096105]|uniref:hypothetical protein n=1 Tax=Streptomyces sp. NPDC096105 TaxID=3366074 RepID=UPI00382BBD4E
MGDLERIIARRSELDALAEELAKRLQEVRAEREELLVAERVLNRLAEADRAEAEAAGVASTAPARVAGRAVLLIPHRGEGLDEAALPGDYRKILAIVRAADGPVQVRTVGEELGLRRRFLWRDRSLIRAWRILWSDWCRTSCGCCSGGWYHRLR